MLSLLLRIVGNYKSIIVCVDNNLVCFLFSSLIPAFVGVFVFGTARKSILSLL